MKQEDVKFVRAIAARINPIYESWVGTDSYECSRLLSLLIESEAMRKKAEFEAEHYWDNSGVTDQCFGCEEEMCKDPRAKYSDADWIANQKKECGI